MPKRKRKSDEMDRLIKMAFEKVRQAEENETPVKTILSDTNTLASEMPLSCVVQTRPLIHRPQNKENRKKPVQTYTEDGVRKAGAHSLSYYKPATHSVGVYQDTMSLDEEEKEAALAVAEKNYLHLMDGLNPYWQQVLADIYTTEEGQLVLANVSSDLKIELKEADFFSKGKDACYDAEADVIFLNKACNYSLEPILIDKAENLLDENAVFVWGILFRMLVFAMQHYLNYHIGTRRGFSAKQRALNHLVVEADARALTQLMEALWLCYGVLNPTEETPLRDYAYFSVYPKPYRMQLIEMYLSIYKKAKKKDKFIKAKAMMRRELFVDLLRCKDALWHAKEEEKILRLLWRDIVLDRLHEEKEGDIVAHAEMLTGIGKKYDASVRRITEAYHLGQVLRLVMFYIQRNISLEKSELLDAVNRVYVHGNCMFGRGTTPLAPIFVDAEQDRENFFS